MQLNRQLGAHIAYEDASKYIRNKYDMHEAMERHKFHMPSVNSPICTMPWMTKVRFAEIYCPKQDQIDPNVQCFSNPTKEILYEKVFAALKSHLRMRNKYTPKQKDALKALGVSMEEKQPNVKWLVDVLGVLSPKDEIFAKSYRYVRPIQE